MAPSYYSCILLYLLHLFIACQAQYELSIAPQNPVVLLGASVQLNCSISCPGGSTTWKGLDTNLGGLYIGTGFSILNIQNASISMEGSMICEGRCPDKKHYRNSGSLHVYALPESLILSAHPEAKPPSLHCFMRAVYVTSDITVKWFKGLESLEASKQKEEWYEDEDGLSYYTWILPFAGDTEWEPRTSYGCEAEINVGGHLFTRKGILHLPQKDTVGIHLATSLNVGIQATSAASSTITYTIPEEYPEILHEVSSPAQEYKSRLPMDTGAQTFPKSPLESPKQLITATIPSSSLPGSSNSFRRFPTAMPTAFQKVFQTSSSRKKHTNLLTEYPTVSTNVNVRSYSKPFISAFQGTQSASVAYYTSEQGRNMKDGQTSPKTESLTSVSTEESTTQMKSVEHLFTTLPLVHQSKLSNTQVRPSPTPWPTTILQFMSSQGIQAANESPTPVIPRGGLALTWVIVPTLSLMGSLMLSFRLWRALRRKGSFIPKQL